MRLPFSAAVRFSTPKHDCHSLQPCASARPNATAILCSRALQHAQTRLPLFAAVRFSMPKRNRHFLQLYISVKRTTLGVVLFVLYFNSCDVMASYIYTVHMNTENTPQPDIPAVACFLSSVNQFIFWVVSHPELIAF